MVAHRAKRAKCPVVFVNLVGGNDGIVFDGASLIADEEGDIILLKGFRGTGETETRGTNVFHISQVTMNPLEGTVQLTIDTKFRDLLSVEEAIARGRSLIDMGL